MTWFGIGLPSDLPPLCDRELFLTWTRRAEECGFHTAAVIDKMDYDLWDPLTALAGAATVTERIRLATVLLQLPNRNAVEVAKRAAVVDQLSGGRLDLGVGLGGHAADYLVVGADYRGRGPRIAEQVEQLRTIWTVARKADRAVGRCGPAPVQVPGPPLWMGGWSDVAVERAAEIADGFVTGIGDPRRTAALAGRARSLAIAHGRTGFACIALAYVVIDGVGDAENYRSIVRYYGGDADREQWIVGGPAGSVAERLQAMGDGFDGVIALPLVADVDFVPALAAALELDQEATACSPTSSSST